MACLLESVCTIIGVFHQHAERRSECASMKRREMKRLLQKEFGDLLENPRDPQIVKLTFQLLDVNRDTLVDFNEFLLLIFEVATACYRGWDPKEGLPCTEERSRDVRCGVENNHWEFSDEEREGDDVHGRRGSDRTPLRPMEENRRGELGRGYLPSEPVEEDEEEEEERNFQERDRRLRDSDRRVRPTREHQERETERRCLEPRRQEDIGTPDDRQPKWEPSLQEGSPRHSREPVRRNDNDRHPAHDPQDRDEPMVASRWEDRRERQGRETEHGDAEGRFFRCGSKTRVDRGNHHTEYDSERSRPSREPREWEDGRRDLETPDEPRTRVAEERRDEIHNRGPVDDYEEHRALPRKGERRSQSHETEHRERERGREERYLSRSRDDVRRGVVRGSERRRDEDDWIRPRPLEVLRRPEVEGLECRERERRRSYSFELQNIDRRSQSHESEGREEVRRSQYFENGERRRQQFNREETQATGSRRRGPQSPDLEPRDPKYGRSQSYEEPRRADRRRPRDNEVHSPERKVGRRRLQAHESVEREDNQERQHDERESRDSERDRRRPMSREPESRDEDQRRPLEIGSRSGESERLQDGDARRRRTGRELASPSDGGRRELDPRRPQDISRCRTAERRRSEPRSLPGGARKQNK